MSRIAKGSFSLLTVLSMMWVQVPASAAQNLVTGSIEGKVYEFGTLNQVGIAGATVVARNEETGFERPVLTRTDGTYYIPYLPSGPYTITATAPNYQDVPNSNISRLVNFPIRITQKGMVKLPPIALQKIGTASPTVPPTTPPTTPQRPRQVTPPATPTTQPPQSTAVLSVAGAEVEQLVNTVNATRGGNFDTRQILALPLPGIRTFDDLAFLVPGVVPPPLAIGRIVGPGIGPGVGTSGQFSVNGLRSRSNNFTIDGSDNNDEEVGVRRQGFTSLVPQTIESVQEFQISTLLAEPQYGRNLGAQVNAVSRAGAAFDYHGTLYGFYTDKNLRARDPFDLTGGPANFPIIRASDRTPVLFNGQPLAPANPVGGEDSYTRSQLGFALGGPVVEQKSLFFLSFERQIINASRESHFAVPTAAERGVFGTINASGVTGLGQGSTRFDRLPNLFPTSVGGNAFLSLYPFPNNPGGPYGPNTFTQNLPAGADGLVFSVRLDQNFSAFGRKHNLTGRYNFTDDETDLPVTGEALFSSLEARVRTQNLSVILNSSFSSSVANIFRASYGRTSLNFNEIRNPFLLPAGRGLNQREQEFLLNAPLIENISFPGRRAEFRSVPGRDTESVTGPLGQVRVSGYSPIGVDVFNFPQGRTNNTFQFADTMSYDGGNHLITAGFDLRRTQLNSFLNRNFRPLAVFSGALDIPSLFDIPNAGLRPFSPVCPGGRDARGNLVPPCFYFGVDFLALGAPTGFFQTQALFPDSTIGLRFWQTSFFLSDQIRVSPEFTLTVGTRYEYNNVPTEINRRIESTFGSPEVQAIPGLVRFLDQRTKIYRDDRNNFGPYISFALDPFGEGTTSIRGGFGIYYDQILGAVVSQSRNVFPTFVTLDLAGAELVRDQLVPSRVLGFVNPATLAVTGTLNTYNPQRFGSPSNLVRQLERAFRGFSAGAAGAAFVLPAADLVTPYSEHWGLTIEQQVKDFLLSAAYVGTRGVHLLRFTTPNLGPNAIPQVTNVGSESGRPVFTGTIVAPSRNSNFAGRPDPLLGSFTSIESDANSIYHALQLQLNKRFSRGIQFTTAYTWSHAIDEVSDVFDLAGALALPQNIFDRRAERGDANFDVRHRFVYSLVWDIDFLGGWQVASIGTFQTGQPYSIISCCDSDLDGNLTDRVGAPNNGVTGRNTFRAPGIATVDLAVNKSFRFGESQRLEFRSEFFNLFNRPHFGIPIHQLFFGGSNTGFRPLTEQIFVDTVVPARTIQFAVKYSF